VLGGGLGERYASSSTGALTRSSTRPLVDDVGNGAAVRAGAQQNVRTRARCNEEALRVRHRCGCRRAAATAIARSIVFSNPNLLDCSLSHLAGWLWSQQQVSQVYYNVAKAEVQKPPPITSIHEPGDKATTTALTMASQGGVRNGLIGARALLSGQQRRQGVGVLRATCQILPLPISRYRFKFQSNLVWDSIRSISNFCFQF
jgi:hypothetical protein